MIKFQLLNNFKDIPFIYLKILEAKRKRRKKKIKKGKEKYDKMDNFG